MATESEAGVKLPPGVGILTKNVVKKRPDLSDMEGFTVRVPRSLDIEANDGPQRVWVQGMRRSASTCACCIRSRCVEHNYELGLGCFD